MDIYLKVGVLAGADIKDACQQLCELAKRLGVPVEVTFNGVIVVARPSTKHMDLVDEYKREVKSDKNYKFAIVN